MATTKAIKLRNKQHVAMRLSQVTCGGGCGNVPVDWHREGHTTKQRVSWKAQHGYSIKHLDEEIALCTPYCRRCHMKHDGRLGKLPVTGVVNLERSEWRQRGEKHPAARLSDVAIADIRQRCLQGETQQAVADRYKVARGWVALVVAGRRR